MSDKSHRCFIYFVGDSVYACQMAGFLSCLRNLNAVL
jgi:hypothetical protein